MPKTSKLGIPYKAGTPEYQREWRKLNPDKVKASSDRYKTGRSAAWRKRRYGITQDQFLAILDSQNSKCAICGAHRPGRGHKDLHVDHNHVTGKVRGLLCDLCNRGLGYFKDNKELLIKAAEYLSNED